MAAVSSDRASVEQDPTSSANIHQTVAQHMHLHLTADFASSSLRGYVQFIFASHVDGLSEVLLDMNELEVQSVCDPLQEAPLEFTVDKAENGLGDVLRVVLADPVASGQSFSLRVYYNTTPRSTGLQWLPADQTDSKTHPYLFSQFQAVHCRSAIPCQDTPTVKLPYTASLTVPAPLVALMSALSRKSSTSDDGKSITYTFEQPQPIPSYLVAIAVGLLESRDISHRCRVWCEPPRIKDCEHEFGNTEEYLKAAEDVMYAYTWERYDLLVLPASFPYGGMENPCLTFITPTLIAGDRSLTLVVAHEIAHSWTGNLVTSRTWRHFWLNEGFTVFVERKIVGRLAGEQSRQFAHLTGNKALQDSIAAFGEEHKQFTSLLLPPSGEDPDHTFSSVPYEKGSQFLFYLETCVLEAVPDQADPLSFENFLRQWIRSNQGGTVTTDMFRAFFAQFYHDARFAGLRGKVDWDAWLNGTGASPVDVVALLDKSLAKDIQHTAQLWLEGREDEAGAGAPSWDSPALCYFLDLLQSHSQGLPADRVLKLRDSFALSQSHNCEIRFRYGRIILKANLKDLFDDACWLLTWQGRMKYLRPLYRELKAVDRDRAVRVFQQYGHLYHPIGRKMVSVDLGL